MGTATAPGALAEGADINSRYRLGSRISETGRQSVYGTIFRGADVVIKVYSCETQKEAVAMLSGFVLASQLPHPGLLTIYDFGQDDTHAWIVMERGEECLADILRERPLNEEETRQMLGSILPALEFLEERHFALAHLQPSNIFACGDRVKLSADRLVKVSGAHDSLKRAELILQTLTGSTDESGAQKLPRPFREIVDGKWDLERTKRALAGEAVEDAPLPVPEAAKVSDSGHFPEIEQPILPKYRKYAGLAVGGALAAAALCALLVRGAHETVPPAAQAPAQNVQIVTPAAPPAPVNVDPVPSRPMAPQGWAIVGASFNREADAVKRAAELRKTHPRLEPQVYRSTGTSTRFVVLFATGLTEAQAKKQLTRTKRSGAPRGTYTIRFE
jgi:serine/threonine-protein kinase